MSGAFERQAARVLLPTSTTSDTFPSSGVNTGGLDLTSFVGSYVTLRASAACHLRAGSAASVAATAGDFPISADTPEPFYVTPETQYLSVYGDAAGTLYVAKSS